MPHETRGVAERVLAEAWGARVALSRESSLAASDRSQVFRYAVRAGSPHHPASVVVKQAIAVDSETYAIDAAHGPAWRLFNEWAGLRFLTELAGPASPAPRFHAGNREAGLIVLEDLGAVTRLDQLLLGEDRQAAVDGLIGYSAALGRMQAMTVGRREAFDRLRDGLGPRQVAPTPGYLVGVIGRMLRELSAGAGVALPPGIEADLEILERFMDPDNPFLAYSHNDPCPDNCLVTGDGVRLVDFEVGSYRHGLLDGVYGRMLFPTCWCVNLLPLPVCEQMEAAYRRELALGCPDAADDRRFNQAVVEACAWRLLTTLSPGFLTKDQTWGISTLRQRVLVRLDRFAAVSAAVGHLPALGATARHLAASLRSLWPTEAGEMPLFPAFR